MDHINNNIPYYKQCFFNSLKKILNTKIYYHGSVQRYDFFNESDIDIDIFSVNELNTINIICDFLNYDINSVKKFIWKLDINGETITGYKLLYYDPKYNYYVDISIFNEKNKINILHDQIASDNLPLYAIGLLVILKFIYYKLQIMSWIIYSYFKKKIITTSLGYNDSEFIMKSMFEN
jgi:hypothetical protein